MLPLLSFMSYWLLFSGLSELAWLHTACFKMVLEEALAYM